MHFFADVPTTAPESADRFVKRYFGADEASAEVEHVRARLMPGIDAVEPAREQVRKELRSGPSG